MHLSHLHEEHKEPNAYTLGDIESYDEAIALGSIKKLPANGNYDGGWVWRTKDEAVEFNHRECANMNFDVYGLILPRGWDKDVSKEPAADGVHRLLHKAEIVKA